jgi:NAD(P)H dehydrogenase (quinone)
MTGHPSIPAYAAKSHHVVLGHPSAESFNAALAQAYVEAVRARGHRAVVRDLYTLKFNPLLTETERTTSDRMEIPDDARHELELALEADIVVFVYPLWFGAPPAIVKGYLDRVFGAANRYIDFYNPDKSPFAGKRLVVISTSGASLPWLEEQGIWVSLRQSFDQYLKAVIGFSRCDHYHADGIIDGLGSTHAKTVLLEVAQFADKICAGNMRT